ncbi:hypothetical protein RIF29_25309 [Crotalaria pallida]|uniref:beta-galactosidase n=1 Tax=Crotalaria pallida TaxID=3830 RepID=A0AAN9ENS0_CROPI
MEVTMGGAHGSHDVKSFSLEVPITLNEGANNISLLSVLVGLLVMLPNSAFLERRFAGLISAEIQCSEVSYDLTNSTCWGYQIAFDSPEGNGPVALNLGSMGKGEAWVNGQSIGRYWILFHDSNNHPSQALYHVPRSFLKDTGNVLVVFEEEGGNPLDISLNTVSSTDMQIIFLFCC